MLDLIRIVSGYFYFDFIIVHTLKFVNTIDIKFLSFALQYFFDKVPY